MKTFSKSPWLLALLFLFINIGFIILISERQLFFKINNDANAYLEIVANINKGYGIGDHIWWPPLYPIFLSIFTGLKLPFLYLSIIQTVCYGICIMIFYQLLRIYSSERCVSILSLILILMPTGAIISKIALADTLFLLFYLIHLLFFVKLIRNFSLQGLLASLILLIAATFTKPTTLYLYLLEFPIILFFLYRIKRINLKNFIISLVLSLGIPWMFYHLWSLRNYYQTGVYVFANVKNYNLLVHNFFHTYPYVKLINLEKDLTLKVKIGDENRNDQAIGIRKYLLNDYLSYYLVNVAKVDPENISWNKKTYYMGQVGTALIRRNLFLYIPIHYLKSIRLFIPNSWEMSKLLINPKFKSMILILDFFTGLLIIRLFIKSIFKFMKFNLRQDRHAIVSILLLINMIYLMSVIGPTAIDDSGRFSIVFLFLVFLFIGLNVNSDSSKKVVQC